MRLRVSVTSTQQESINGLKQASRTLHANLGFDQCKADVCVFRLIEDGHVAITAVVHVDDIFAVGREDIYNRCVWI